MTYTDTEQQWVDLYDTDPQEYFRQAAARLTNTQATRLAAAASVPLCRAASEEADNKAAMVAFRDVARNCGPDTINTLVRILDRLGPDTAASRKVLAYVRTGDTDGRPVGVALTEDGDNFAVLSVERYTDGTWIAQNGRYDIADQARAVDIMGERIKGHIRGR